jgi:hypothetical protein
MLHAWTDFDKKLRKNWFLPKSRARIYCGSNSLRQNGKMNEKRNEKSENEKSIPFIRIQFFE